METLSPTATSFRPSTKSMLIGTGLAFASLILVPALAHRLGMNMPLIGALRIGLMRASSRAVTGRGDGGETDTTCGACH